MVGHHPADLLGHERLQDRVHHLAVGVGREQVADVVQQRRHDVLLAAAVAKGARGGLERVLLARDLVAPVGLTERLNRGEHPVGERSEHLPLVAIEQLVVLGGRLVHSPEGDGLHGATILGCAPWNP